jgi:PAS domain S-box-containing protein
VDGAPIRVLLVTGHAPDAARISASLTEYHGAELAGEPFDLVHASSLEVALRSLAEHRFHVILADLALPDSHGLTTFARLYAQAPELPIVVLADRDTELLALKAVHHGALEYILKEQVHGGLVARAAHYAVQRRATEEALALERERLSVTLHSIGEGVITADTAGRVTLINRVAEALTGWTQEEGAGRLLGELFHLEDERTRERREDSLAHVLATGTAIDLPPATLRSRSGEERLIEATAAPIRDRDGTTIGVVLAFRDVAARRQLQEERLRASKLESIGSLAGGIAHDFNNLLTTVLGSLSLARDPGAPAGAHAEALAAAEGATLRARDLTRQLLTFAEGGAPIKTTSALRALIQDAARFTLRNTPVRAEFSIPEELWPAEVDEGQFGHVISHLVRNAEQAMPEGGTLRLRCHNVLVGAGEAGAALPLRQGRYVVIAVEDEGGGIPADVLPRIFDPYFTTRAAGSGLGLAICYSVVARHGGIITADSEPGRGSTFRVYLPAAAPPAAEPIAAPRVTPAEHRILVMDDDDMVGTVVQRMLVRLGYDVALARDGAEAVLLYQQERDAARPFSAVIMDLTVPGGMGGKEAVQQLRTIAPALKAIVSSGYFNDPIMAHPREHGFDAVIAKPYQLEALRRVLEQVLGGGQASGH